MWSECSKPFDGDHRLALILAGTKRTEPNPTPHFSSSLPVPSALATISGGSPTPRRPEPWWPAWLGRQRVWSKARRFVELAEPYRCTREYGVVSPASSSLRHRSRPRPFAPLFARPRRHETEVQLACPRKDYVLPPTWPAYASSGAGPGTGSPASSRRRPVAGRPWMQVRSPRRTTAATQRAYPGDMHLNVHMQLIEDL